MPDYQSSTPSQLLPGKVTDVSVTVDHYIEQHNYESIYFLPIRQQRLLNIRYLHESVVKGRWPWQVAAVVGSCFCTVSIAPSHGVDLAQAMITTLASLVVPQLSAAAAVGAYAAMTTSVYQPRFSWSVLIAGLITVLWLVCNHFKVLAGWGGRLGTMAFGVSNVIVPIVAAAEPSLILDASVYWAGGTQYSGGRKNDRAASGGKGFHGGRDLSTGTIVATTAAVTIAALLTKLIRESGSPTLQNPISAGSAVGLTLMIIWTACVAREPEFDHHVMGAIGEGSFIGMAGDGVLYSPAAFALAGLIGGGLNLLLDPFTRGFGGKQGFLALLSCLIFRGADRMVAAVRLGMKLPPV